jgi:hypothetical protein
MAALGDNQLREMICDENLPGVAYMLVWSELDEDSDGHNALSQVLFDHESVENPDDAPTRDLLGRAVRMGVFNCALRHSDVRNAIEDVLSGFSEDIEKKPWWKFW